MGESWRGWRRLRVAETRAECAGVATLWLEPADAEPLPPYRAGQYVTLRLRAPGWAEALVRCYSLCEASPAAPERYAITVKRIGRASSYLVDQARPGDALEARAPAGDFTVEPGPDPLVLVAGGIGVTPLRSLAQTLLAEGDPGREVHFFHGVRRGDQHPFRADLRALAARSPRVHLHVAYSRPGPQDRRGVDFHHRGRVTVDLLTATLPPADRPYAFYVCGPPAMSEALLQGLEGLGVPPGRVRLEPFGAGTVRPLTRRLARGLLEARGAAGEATLVTFARAGRTVPWLPEHGALLELGLANDVFVPFACAAGRCGTCVTPLLAGEVVYPVAPQFRLRPGLCLPCVAVPRGPVTLDA